MKNFTEADVEPHSAIAGGGKIYLDRFEDMAYKPGMTKFQASGYPVRGTDSGWRISFEGTVYKVKLIQESNAGSLWFNIGKREIYLS